jgi:hypothetical protein
VDTHRNVSQDELDGSVHQPERADAAPYRDLSAQPEPRTGYSPRDRQSPSAAPVDTGGRWPADGVMAMPVGPRSGEPLPPAYTPASAPPAYTPASAPPAYTPEPLAAPGTVHTAPTSGLPFLTGDGTQSPTGRPPLAGDARPVSGGSAWSGGDSAEETQVVRRSTEAIDRAALRRPSGAAGQFGEGVYRSRRPGLAVAIVAVTVLVELMALRLLASSFLASKVQVGDSIASSFLVLGLPMFGFGLYGLLRGAAATPGAGVQAWLRPPLVYLPVALTLFVTAGLAAA